jgi:hypothetical protein
MKEELPEGIITYNTETGLWEIDEEKYDEYKSE